MFEERNAREHIVNPLKILVLTFNRTLAGYVAELVENQVNQLGNAEITIETFGKWAKNVLGEIDIVSSGMRERTIKGMAKSIPLSPDYVVKEVDYLLGRLLPEKLEEYINAERTGRGLRPRVDRHLRRQILDDVVYPYKEWLQRTRKLDWNDVAVRMSELKPSMGYDIVIIDESQDFSANQLRAVSAHLADRHAVTFVIDTVQRIYARGFSWPETGFDMRGTRYHQLTKNHRNTREIAAFAAGLLDGMTAEDDGMLPRLESATTHGPLPTILRGRYNQQVAWALQFIRDEVDLEVESVAFLKPLGGGFFGTLEGQLDNAQLPYVMITREAEWPQGNENIALSTFHSAKGLEFDHVIILGLNAENTSHGDEEQDDQLTVLRKLLAVAVARARKTVAIGYKPGEQSDLVEFFKAGTFQEVRL